MTKSDLKKSERLVSKQTVECRYTRSAQCRSLHVDGGIVEFGPKNQITLALYAEHFPPPLREVFSVEGDRAQSVNTEEVSGFVREIEAICYLDIETARWLNEQLGLVLDGIEEAK